ncbi:hypothetical protein SJ05684_b56710 (plasmid) [Sinorhizobium sojae CCBAU 05684]|uniref:Uncharacterized protein n=1 Tax=Sinorhizobium sojae CCBAU 05684 TaxID=716928 RepID=A0A249PL44_9HYPH|nr:hypothetical protein SJ05684_b56710 [Sinorhizobium sojae CCBAU 05684]
MVLAALTAPGFKQKVELRTDAGLVCGAFPSIEMRNSFRRRSRGTPTAPDFASGPAEGRGPRRS